MGATYQLVNVTKQETLLYMGIPAHKARELAGNGISARITTWYMLQNRGDLIGFVSDYDEKWPLPEGSWKALQGYREVTEELISSMVSAEILEDHGTLSIDGDPDLVDRVLKVIW